MAGRKVYQPGDIASFRVDADNCGWVNAQTNLSQAVNQLIRAATGAPETAPRSEASAAIWAQLWDPFTGAD